MQQRRSEELRLRSRRPSVHVAIDGEVVLGQAAVAKAQFVTTGKEWRGSALCVQWPIVSPLVRCLPPKIYRKSDDAGHLAPRGSDRESLGMIPMQRERGTGTDNVE